MAVLTGLPGLSATIRSQGGDLPEYPDDGEWSQDGAFLPEGRRSSTYVQCLSDAEFSIHFNLDPPFRLETQSLTLIARVDGRPICRFTSTRDSMVLTLGRLRSVIDGRVKRVSPTECISYPLKFSAIKKGSSHTPRCSRVYFNLALTYDHS